jgi:hypothetical protein
MKGCEPDKISAFALEERGNNGKKDEFSRVLCWDAMQVRCPNMNREL